MKTIKMYLLERENRDDDYIAVLDGQISVHSSLLKTLWTNPNKIDLENFTFPYTLESYYGDENILNNATLLWEHTL